MGKVLRFFKSEPVFTIALLAALLSMIAVPPSAAYAGYIRWRTLGLLLVFMLCVAGLQSAGVFSRVAHGLLRRVSRTGQASAKAVCAILVALPFFCAMLVTNDVSLLTFVPFAILLLQGQGRGDLIPLVVTLQTIAANGGSYLTPIGNPHNLYCYTLFDVPIGEFLSALAPFTITCGIALALCIFLFVRGKLKKPMEPGAAIEETVDELDTLAPQSINKLDAALFGALILVAILSVLKLIPLIPVLVLVVLVTLVRDWRLLGKVNWVLLATFVCFFIFSSNLAAIPAISDVLTSAMSKQPFWISVASSQVISNVPTCTLLAPFTSDWRALAVGTDLGGLGSPVGSLASLITLGFYRQLCADRKGSPSFGRFMGVFLAINFCFLALTCLVWVLL